jgi:hypothetical protein
MSPNWLVAAPVVIVGIALVILFIGKRLQFFSHSARHLDQIDIPNEVREIRINELEALVGDEADWMFKNGWKITPGERRQAVTDRHQQIRKWLHLLISNCALFCEVARFHIQEADSAESDLKAADLNPPDLPMRVMDRAALLQLMAAVCLGKLLLLDCCRLAWPLYVPQLADHLQVRGHDLVAWYRHLGKEMLELAERYYDDITYTRFIFQLTGVFTVEEAAELNRL